MSDPRIRDVKIKTGVVKRLAKDELMYIAEVKEQEGRIERLKTKGEDEYVIKKQVEVLQECKMMVPDCRRRLESSEDLAESKEYVEARGVLDSVEL
ncbi:hypothetical protein CRUP_017413 [Coryphaenoides rupestris]|nr:hypothetical protein CRUP_017413 [Coryphaenoides rupestris]